MLALSVGLVLFLGIHSVSIVVPGWRDARHDALGENAWKGLYSLISAIGLGLIIWGYGRARENPVVLYSPPLPLRHFALLVMAPAFPLLLAAYFPGRIKTAMKHPMLVAVKLWAVAHLLANGTLADVLLFGSFLAWAVADRISLKRRVQRPIPTLPASGFNDVIVVVGGLALYVLLLFWGHRWITGTPLLG